MLEKIKNLLKNKKIIIGATIFIVLTILIIFFIHTKMLTKLEKVKITEISNELSYYFDEITEYQDDEGKYISFALEYLYNNTDKEEYSSSEVINVINSKFDLKYDLTKASEIGITKQMLDKNIVYDVASDTYKYSNIKTRADIANIPIIKFELKKIKKINKNKFKVIYNKYVVENPYEILNYYNNYNISQNEKEDKDTYDTTDIVEYLKGNRKQNIIKDIINSENINEFGTLDGTLTIIYVIKDNKLVIKKIG